MIGQKRFKILIADDERELRVLLKKNLTTEGYDVILAADGEETLEKVKNESPDLVVLDVKMPKMDGIEVLQRIKQDPITRTLPVILLTIDPDILKGYKYGADYYITKPFKLASLTNGIDLFFRTTKK